MRLVDISPFAAVNHGLITMDAARRLGISRSAFYRAIDSALLIVVHPNVCRIPGSPETREQRISAAVLALAPHGLASHRSAAHLFGIPRPDGDPIEVIVTARERRPALKDVLIHRPRDLGDLNPVRRHNIDVCNLLRMLCDYGAVDPAALPAAVGHVVGLRWATLGALRAAADRHSRRGRPGIPALRDALAEWDIDGKPPDSVLEPAMAQLLNAHGIGPWQFHAMIAGFEVDFWIVGTPIVLECDGWDAHARSRELMEWHAERDTKLIASGHLPVHFTYRQIVKQPGTVAKRISEALEIWTARLR